MSSLSVDSAILNSLGDKSKCYAMMHERNAERYNKIHQIFIIVSIIMPLFSVLSLLSISNMNSDSQHGYISSICGFLVIEILVLFTYFYFAIPQELMLHRMSCTNWNKLNRDITSLMLDSERKDAKKDIIADRTKMLELEYNRLCDISPKMQKIIIKNFNKYIAGEESLKNINKPDICGKIMTTESYINAIKQPIETTGSNNL